MAVQEDETETAFLRTVEETCSDLPHTEEESVEEEAPKKPASLTDKLGKIAESEGFSVDQMLGKGGMGAVMLATDRAIGRKVALKFLALPDMADQKALDSLRQEASRVGGLSHENIVQLYSWHSVGRLTFFAMEYVDGDNMQQLVQRETRMKPEKILRIMAEATSGVAAAHEQNIIHRDIKPANIMISKSGRVKVTDFGLASTDLDERARKRVKISGTLGFMAPEQARGEMCTRTGDVYGLAATLYYALARASPYGPPTNMRTMLALNQEGRHKPLREVAPRLHPVLYDLVERGLEPDPRHRTPDAATFRREIEQAMLALSEPPPKPPLRERLGLPRWVSFISLAIGFAAGCIAGGSAVWIFISFF